MHSWLRVGRNYNYVRFEYQKDIAQLTSNFKACYEHMYNAMSSSSAVPRLALTYVSNLTLLLSLFVYRQSEEQGHGHCYRRNPGRE